MVNRPFIFHPQFAGHASTLHQKVYKVKNRPLSDGRVEIDNNGVENAIRPTAVGKKNWLFIGAAEAGERSAIIYTVIESCRRRGLDPYAYLKDVLTRLPHMTNHQVADITPEAWGKAQRKLQQSAA
jgi:hypothetical protein